MELILPNGQKRKIDEQLKLEEKIKLVKELTDEFEDEIIVGWETPRVKYFLDSLSNFLCWHKEEDKKGTEDKDINSKWKEEKSDGRRKSKIMPFSSLKESDKQKIGIGGENIG